MNETGSRRLVCTVGSVLAFLTVLYFVLPETARGAFIGYVSAATTTGILVLTAFYVVYTSRQVVEIQKQRQLQIQPLPYVNVLQGAILSPRPVWNPDNDEIVLVVDIALQLEIKNLGNGTAILVDVFGFFREKDGHRADRKWDTNRFLAMEQGYSATHTYDIRDDDFGVLSYLNNEGSKVCVPGPNRVLCCQTMYRNILGADFLASLDHAVYVDPSDQPTLSDWLAKIRSFQTAFADELAKYKATMGRSRSEAMTLFSAVLESFLEKCPPAVVPITVMQIPQTFRVGCLTAEEARANSARLSHGFPVVSFAEAREPSPRTGWRHAVLRRNFYSDVSELAKIEGSAGDRLIKLTL